MIKNWLVRGDTHGSFLWMKNGCLDKFDPKETAIIILGDAGFNFFLNERDDRIKKEISDRGFTIYCVRGNHEARPQDIKGMQLINDNDVHGLVYWQEKYPNICYFMDYGIYTIDNHKVGVIGGAYSVDKWFRLARFGIDSELHPNYTNSKMTGWFYNEQLNEEEQAKTLELFQNQNLHFMFTHTCPLEWQPTDLFLNSIDQNKVDKTMEILLQQIKDNCNWRIWLFGHFHDDRIERPFVEMYYKDVESLDAIWNRWLRYDKTGEIDWWLNKSPNFYIN